MGRYNYERLSAQDTTFLFMEHDSVYMHVASTAVYEAGPLRTPNGGIDIDKYRRGVESVLHLIPRYRQKLRWIPFLEHPVWVDDRHFDLNYHIRHTSLPRPGTREQLKSLASRVMAQPLDRSKPLWEFWVVEGLEDDQFALISKVHHCMIDGSSGVDLATTMMSLTPEHDEPAAPPPYIPRAAPSRRELFFDEVTRMLSLPLAAVKGFREFNREAESLTAEIDKRAKALAQLLPYAVSSASETPLNGKLGPHRLFDWLTTPLEEMREVRRALDCTVNDLVLATVAGAVREYFIRRRIDTSELSFRVSAPVSVRREEDRGKMGNKVSSWILKLPIHEADPVRRLQAIHEVTQQLKDSEQALGVQMIMAAAEWAPSQLLSLGSQATAGPINMIVTNVPGPQVPLYMLGARLLEMYPQVPLLENTGLGVALFSYDGNIFWGFNADRALVPDVNVFSSMIKKSFEELRDSALQLASKKPAPARKKAKVVRPAAKAS
jgi:diacylglycerol O-acyltransferase